MTGYSNTAIYLIHAVLGSCIGFFTSCIFLALYYGTVYSTPISESLRFKNAFWDTMGIVFVIFTILFFRDIKAWLQTFDSGDVDEEG